MILNYVTFIFPHQLASRIFPSYMSPGTCKMDYKHPPFPFPLVRIKAADFFREGINHPLRNVHRMLGKRGIALEKYVHRVLVTHCFSTLFLFSIVGSTYCVKKFNRAWG